MFQRGRIRVSHEEGLVGSGLGYKIKSMKRSHTISEEFWVPFGLEDQQSRGFRMGPLLVWVRRDGDDWLAMVNRENNPLLEECIPNVAESAPETGDWRRLGSVAASPKIRLAPLMPNRPVVVRPEVPYTILPGEKIQFYVGVPLWVGLYSTEDVILVEEPVVKLSNTWFGTPMEGELAYAMRTLARREVEDLDFHPWRAVCPVRIKNQSKEKLQFERICLRVRYLDLYANAAQGIWANESGLTIRGDNSWSRITYGRGAPGELKKAKLLENARDEIRGGFSLKSLTGAGGFFQ
jgi:hypothetical protein